MRTKTTQSELVSISHYLELMRVHQYVKNLFIFIPLFFSGSLFHTSYLITAFIGFFSFSLLSSSVYILNDFVDQDADRLHPKKKNRPIASGKIKNWQAIILMCATFSFGMSLAFLLNKSFFVLGLIYWVTNILYSFFLKHVPLIDVFIIAFGFIIRVVSGGVLNQIQLSHWLLMMVFLLALFLGFAKRRDDVYLQENSNTQTRRSVTKYSTYFIDAVITMLAAIIIISYLMYTFTPSVIERFNNEYIYASVVFVILGLVRYLQLAIVENKTGSPTEVLLKDKLTLINISLWVLCFFGIIYY
ncbi:decaprenyl-phosphate phosphoribosyltransferase [Limibacter armeniacum]|uniref:decaprenyl-phosphate phosphoribosyltransferase n=1 Tax=Limibacter armeniacum TaxID=466084 RepID=UPI002FE6AC05